MRRSIVSVALAGAAVALLLMLGASAAAARSWVTGTLIQAHEISAPSGARAWRILYRSTTSSGVPVAVLG